MLTAFHLLIPSLCVTIVKGHCCRVIVKSGGEKGGK